MGSRFPGFAKKRNLLAMTKTKYRSAAQERIRTWSIETGRSLEDLRRTLGISRTTLDSYLNGYTEPPVSRAGEIERVTGGYVRLEHFRPIEKAARRG